MRADGARHERGVKARDLSRSRPLAGVAARALDGFALGLERRWFAAGETLIKQGAPPSEAFLLESGTAEIVVRRPGGYEIVETRQLSENHYVIDFDVRSDVDFISVPFCLRLACDGAIAVALHSLGATKKAFPVWADRVYLDGSVNIKPNRIVPCDFSLSPFGGKGPSKVTIVRFAVDGGKFSGFVRLKFRTS